MRVNKEVTYSAGYRPRIVFARVEVKYYPEKLRATAKVNPGKVRSKVKSFISDYHPIVVDDNSLVPTIRMQDIFVKRVWPYSEQLLKDSFAWISDIQIMKDLSRVNYNFNQKTH